jgi:hypothetical protein
MRLKFLLFNAVGFPPEIKEEKEVNCDYFYAFSSRRIPEKISLPSNPIDTRLLYLGFRKGIKCRGPLCCLHHSTIV